MASQTINISLPSELVDEIDELARQEFTSRSDVIRTSLIKRVRSSKKLAQKDLAETLALLYTASKDLETSNVSDEEIDAFVQDIRSK